MRRIFDGLPFVAYLAVSLALFGRGAAMAKIFQPGTDPIAYIWFLKWWPFALSHEMNPFYTQQLWSPVGFSVLWANSIPTLSLLMWPVTATVSAESSWTFLCLAAPALNAYTAFLLIRYLIKNSSAALIGGFLFGFSPYVSSHMLGHVSLTMVPLIPLIALVASRRARDDMGRLSYILALSLLVILQFGISMEVLATAALFGTIIYVAFYQSMRASLDMKGLAVDTLIAAGVCIVILSPAFYFLWLGSTELPKVINNPIVFSNDLLGFVIPMPTVWLGGDALTAFTQHFSATASEQNAYLGLPLIVTAIVAFRSVRGASWTKPLGWATLIAAITSLGPIIWIAGHHFKAPLPGIVLIYIPLLKHALPGRFALYTSLGVSIIISTWLARSPSRVKLAVASLCAAFILPNPGAFSFVSYKTPTVFTTSSSLDRLSSRGAVVVLPYGRAGNSVLWQSRADFKLNMAGGYVGFTPKSFTKWRAVDYFSGVDLPDDQSIFQREILAFCRANHVGSIVIEASTPNALVERLHALKWPLRIEDDSEVIDVPI